MVVVVVAAARAVVVAMVVVVGIFLNLVLNLIYMHMSLS